MSHHAYIRAYCTLEQPGVEGAGYRLDQHISKGYIYFAMAFSVFVEMLNLRIRRIKPPIERTGARITIVIASFQGF